VEALSADVSAALLTGVPQRLLDAHHAVNEEISTRMRARRSGLNDLHLN